MKNYYDVLEIEKTVDAQQIKSAYYKKVRQYPPERFPEEFKQVREAYEVLCDEEKRASYDLSIDMPDDAYLMYQRAVEASREGRSGEYEALMKSIIRRHPKLSYVKKQLALWYERCEKWGNAIKLWENLNKSEPQNNEYSIQLAMAYNSRGWKKKSLNIYNKIVTVSPEIEEGWLGFFSLNLENRHRDKENLIAIYNQALTSLDSNGVKAINLYELGAIVFCANQNLEMQEVCIKRIIDFLKETGDPDKLVNDSFIAMLLSVTNIENDLKIIPLYLEMADLIPDLDKDIRSSIVNYDKLHEIEYVLKKGFSELLHDLLVLNIDENEKVESKYEIMAMECHLLTELSTYRPEIIRLRKEHPRLYDLHSEFFKEITTTREPDKLLYKRTNILSKKGYFKGFENSLDYDDQVQTVRRENPKVGRNDPCPCGSGKKYKKCCGQ